MDNMDSVSVINKVLEQKFESYRGSDIKDFVAPSELTVTITLSEYRELVSKVATRDEAISAAEHDRYEREQKITDLQAEVDALKAELYELQKRAENGKRNEDTAAQIRSLFESDDRVEE